VTAESGHKQTHAMQQMSATKAGGALAIGRAIGSLMVTRAQQHARIRRVGVLMQNDEANPEANSWLSNN
jgi:hypothetical protein